MTSEPETTRRRGLRLAAVSRELTWDRVSPIAL